MAQFDVHRNPGQHRDSIPYVVVVQSAIFDGYQRRVVIPLVRKSHLGLVHHARLNPTFTVEGIEVVLHPLEIVSVPAAGLGAPIASLAEWGGSIIDATDELLSRSYG
jgi:toxin CcdB